ncbi:MAG: nucleoside deaminase [Phycisphaeraceae bacterium]|nr:nucleoside deaminase [Phycisphaeraceae bacterium]
MAEALREARQGLNEGGIPIGAALVDRRGEIVSRGHNMRVQLGDPTAHAEMICLRNAGRRRDWSELILITTLSPCIMCSGAALLFGIRNIVIGENQNFLGAENLLIQHGVKLTVLRDPRCQELLKQFIDAYPEVWNEDIGLPPPPDDADHDDGSDAGPEK